MDTFMKHLNGVFIQAAILTEKLSVDEKTIIFHETSKLKVQIKYKRRGDGFQCDSICANGYTVTFYFCYPPAPKNILKKVCHFYIHESYLCLIS